MEHDVRQDETTEQRENVAEDQVQLPAVSHQESRLLQRILLAYWAVVLACLPIWWSMTSIQRLPLPVSRILVQQQTISEFTERIPVAIQDHHGQEVDASFQRSVQHAIDECRVASAEDWRSFEVQIVSSTSEGVVSGYSVSVRQDGQLYHVVNGRNLDFHGKSSANDAHDLGKLLCQLLNPTAGRPADNRVTQYASNIRISLSLLNEDATQTTKRGWGAERLIQENIHPILEALSQVHNFTIESQVQYHAPLAFEPPRRQQGEHDYYSLGEDELKIFINSAEWTLSSKITNDPVIHLIAFIPSMNHSPMHIYDEKNHRPLDAPGFIIPQWGGVVLMNNQVLSGFHALTETQAFSTFRTQLLTLLGVPALPSNVKFAETHSGSLSEWQVDALLRKRTRENAEGSIQALTSIVKLVDQLENMPVGPDVRDDVLRSLEELEFIQSTNGGNASERFANSRRALEYSSRAFFNPGMVGQLYFPAEHKYAIYMLFAPASMPLIVTGLKMAKGWFRKRREKKIE
ncbi:SubName: Full=Uncharacterized protein {ECO:0000313/EMBL:KIM28034.1} [Serendipita indica DSM 11827]|nr:SubName: Full=Uncharacterized protein {ECO:0000313/EMBL:KIM28034.1} [Serendipita indica DSM 11827]